MMNRPGDPVVTAEGMAQSYARLRAERDADPQLAAMAAAAEPTKEERVRIEAAQLAVIEAEAAVNEAASALAQSRKPSTSYDKSRPFTFFQRSLSTHKTAQAVAPELASDLAERRMQLQHAIRRRNAVTRAVEAARMARRQAAKLKHTPKPAPVRGRADGWASLAGRKDA